MSISMSSGRETTTYDIVSTCPNVYYDVVWYWKDVYYDMSMSITMSVGIGTRSITTYPHVVIDVVAGVIDVVDDM